MPAPWEKYQQQPAQPGPWSKYQTTEAAPAKTASKSAEAPGFFERGYDATIGGVVNMGKEILSKGAPRVVDEMGTAIKNRYVSNPQQTTNPYARGLDAVFGPVVDTFAEDVKTGNYLGAAGTATGNALMLGLPAILRKGKSAAAARSGAEAAQGASTAPTAAPTAPAAATPSAYAIEGSSVKGPMAKAVQYADQQGIPVTTGERMNSPMVQKIERMAEMVPGSSSVATDFYEGRNQAIIGKGQKTVKKLGGAAEDNTAAAQSVIDRVQGRNTDLREFYKKKYGNVDEAVERNRAKLQAEQDAKYQAEVKAAEKYNRAEMAYANTRRQLAYESGLNPDALPAPKLKDIPKPPPPVMGAEVKLKPIQTKLKSFYDELNETMPSTQREASPGYARLRSIMDDVNESKSALDLERDLSEIKRVLRSESGGYSATKSGRYALQTIKAIEGELLGAIEKAGGPKAVDNLLKARAGVREAHRTFDALEKFLPKGQSPAKLFDRAVTGGDKMLNELVELKQRAPDAVREIGATYLDGALGMIRGEGGTADITSAVKQWKRLGPRTKVELYGKQTAAELDAFFENAPKLIKNVNPSGTAYANQASKVLTSGGLLMGAMTGGMEGAAGGLATAAAGAGSARAIANFLFKPGNAKTLQNAMRFSRDPGASKFFMNKLNQAVEADPELLALLQSARTDTQAPPPNQ